MKTVAITGATGNLGWKFVQHMASHADVASVIGLDLDELSSDQLAQLSADQADKCEFIACDLLDWHDRRWREAIKRSDAVVHFAAQNPFPEASWDDANRSLDMTLNAALASVDAGVSRFVFVSSNHVMGRYKDAPLADTIGPGELTTSLEHAVGTVWQIGERAMDSTPYAVAKSSGERLCQALATRAEGRTTFVSVRIGWCQPGRMCLQHSQLLAHRRRRSGSTATQTSSGPITGFGTCGCPIGTLPGCLSVRSLLKPRHGQLRTSL
ncbi:MAG: NAD(P)-dependent oxidoreductase [Planctomycetaceae bacterium]